MSRDNCEIAHRWAHQDGSRATGSHLSFSGKVLKSYSTAIGELIDLPDGTRGVVYNATTYSQSTTRHQSYMRSATSHMPSVTVFNPRGESAVVGRKWTDDYKRQLIDKDWARAQIKASLRKAAEFQEKSMRARTAMGKSGNGLAAHEWLANAATLAAWFKVKAPSTDLGKLATEIAEFRRKEAARHARFQKKLERENAKKIEEWLSGAGDRLSAGIDKVYLRRRRAIESDDSQLETSKGAIVPWDDAVKLFRFARAKRGKGWRRNGESFAVGPYQLDAVNAQGIVAGCHRISFDEMERLAEKEGVRA